MNSKPHLIALTPSKPVFHLTWVVSNICNYRCSYCREDIWDGSWPNTEKIEDYKAAVLELFRIYSNAGKEVLHVFFSGGEPTYWKPFLEICAFINEEAPKFFKSHSLALNTNLSRPLDWWKAHGHLFDEITASYHVEKAMPEKFVENVQYLGDKCSLLVRLMMMPSRFEEIKAVGEWLKQECDNFSLEYARLYSELSWTAEQCAYEPEDEEFMRRNSRHFEQNRKPRVREVKYAPQLLGKYSDGTTRVVNTGELSANKENYFRGWTCQSGDTVTISQDGGMWTASCGQGPYIGNPYKGTPFDFSKLLKPVKCAKDLCHCGADIQIPKFKNSESSNPQDVPL